MRTTSIASSAWSSAPTTTSASRSIRANCSRACRRCCGGGARFRRRRPEQREPFSFGRFRLDFQSRTLQQDDKPITLSGSEFALLKIFVNNPMRTLTRERLLELLHGPEYDGTDRGIDVQVWRLRRILETDPSAPRFIQTVRGRGYVFVPDGEQNAPAH